MNPVLNLSAYRFVALSELTRWRDRIREQAAAANLKGTVLIAEEGINLFIAGTAPDVQAFFQWITQHIEFAALSHRQTWSDSVPFGKLLVKVKPEIIRMNHPTIRPQAERAPIVDAKTLARWLDAGVDDAGREVITLDTRNAFEVDHGRFRGAHDWKIAKFSDFPAAFEAHRADLEGKTVVSYCTGGIRCEKAALLMQRAGIENVLQLDGGILKYFEATGGKHFQGNCFVFDQRSLLNDTLAPVWTL